MECEYCEKDLDGRLEFNRRRIEVLEAEAKTDAIANSESLQRELDLAGKLAEAEEDRKSVV